MLNFSSLVNAKVRGYFSAEILGSIILVSLGNGKAKTLKGEVVTLHADNSVSVNYVMEGGQYVAKGLCHWNNGQRNNVPFTL